MRIPTLILLLSAFALVFGFYGWTNGRHRDGQSPWRAAPPRTYSARGALANVCVVVPEWNMVIARVAVAPDESKTSDPTMERIFRQAWPGRGVQTITA